jgi:hypothetical protein
MLQTGQELNVVLTQLRGTLWAEGMKPPRVLPMHMAQLDQVLGPTRSIFPAFRIISVRFITLGPLLRAPGDGQ